MILSINDTQGMINTYCKELMQRMRATNTYIHLQEWQETRQRLDNAWFFYHSNTQTAWNRFKANFIPFSLPYRLKQIYFQRAEEAKEKLAFLDRRITELERQPKPAPRRASAPELPRVYPSMFAKQPEPKKSSVLKYLPRLLFG